MFLNLSTAFFLLPHMISLARTLQPLARYLPRTDAYLTLWGLADIKKNDVPYLNNVFAHFVLTRGLRNHDYEILQRQDDDDIEAYLLISSTTNQTLPFPGGFLYLFWPEVNLREA